MVRRTEKGVRRTEKRVRRTEKGVRRTEKWVRRTEIVLWSHRKCRRPCVSVQESLNWSINTLTLGETILSAEHNEFY